MAKAFPVKEEFTEPGSGNLDSDLKSLSVSFNEKGESSPFSNTGMMIDGAYWTMKTKAAYSGKHMHLRDVLEPLSNVPDEYLITEDDLNGPKGWRYQKGAKKIVRQSAGGHSYTFSEGALIFPDPLDKASRTIITGEGGRTATRFKHVIVQGGRYRRLIPIELERLNMFPDNHTKLEGITDSKRAFFMGNALVVGVVERLAAALLERISEPV